MGSQETATQVLEKEIDKAGSDQKVLKDISKNNKKHKSVSYSKYGYLFIAPFFIVYAIFQLYPLIYTIYLSFNKSMITAANKVVGPKFIGLDNYTDMLTNEFMLGSFRNTLIMWGINFVPQILLALLLAAWFTDTRIKIRGQGAYKVLIFMPNIITAASISVLFYSLFAFPQGPVNTILASVGAIDSTVYFSQGNAAKVAIDFLSSGWATRLIVAFINFWMWYGNTMIILIAGVLGISTSLFEAAEVDGATGRQIFFGITLPMIKPILLFTLITSLIGGMQMFDIPQLMQRQSSPAKPMLQSVTGYIYSLAFGGTKDFGRSATVSVFLFLFTAVCSIVLFYIMRDKEAIELRKLERKRLKAKQGGM